MLGLLDEAAVHLDVVVVGIGFGTKLDDGLAVDRYPAFDDQQFGFAARRDARGGEDLLKTFFGHLLSLLGNCGGCRILGVEAGELLEFL